MKKGRLRGVLFTGQADGDGSAALRIGGDGDISAMSPDNLASDSQAKPRTAGHLGARRFHTMETIKQAGCPGDGASLVMHARRRP